ncbi:hypothetical protein SAMN05660742_10333 [Propionispira arboris]|uniref:Asp23 family, cell envelope-related function n=1 Tax=Propionispira arboris TaxID=84035 RepID=A0A1H6W2A7_9FIRM|nr:alkaline shock response membrane anchor protein AmaP [Propionispira arboris]SEJ06652.1 hypothetical protein SAMN05660742_10333 [Propionispira arboris]
MGVINRILLFIYTIAFAVLSLAIVVLCTGVIPIELVWNNFLYLYGRYETGVAAFVVFLVSIQLMGISFSSNKKMKYASEAILIHGDLGDVSVAVDAVKNLVDKTARAVRGIRDVKVRVLVEAAKGAIDTNVSAHLTVVIGQEINVTEISDQLQTAIKENVKNILGLETLTVTIAVDNITNVALQKQRVM